LPKSAVIEADEPQKENIGVPESESLGLEDALPEAVPAVVVPDLQAVSLFDEPAVPAPPDDIPSPDEGLTPAQKQEFVRLVRKEMPLEERAKQLAVLARMKGTKTAAVGLRAIQFIAQLEGWTDDASTDVPPMFSIPDGSQVAIAVKVPSK
jgi:hypothetical protein